MVALGVKLVTIRQPLFVESTVTVIPKLRNMHDQNQFTETHILIHVLFSKSLDCRFDLRDVVIGVISLA